MINYVSDPVPTPNNTADNSQNNTGLVVLLLIAQFISILTTIFVYFVIYSKNKSKFNTRSYYFRSPNPTPNPNSPTRPIPTISQFIPLSNQIKLEYSQGSFDKMQSDATQLHGYAVTNEEKSIAYYWQGLASFNLKKYNEAETFLNQAIVINPNYAAPYATLGAIALTKQDGQKMLEYSSKCVGLDPNYAWCHNNLGISYLMTNQKNKGIEELRQAVKLDPTSYTFNDNLKRALAQ